MSILFSSCRNKHYFFNTKCITSDLQLKHAIGWHQEGFRTANIAINLFACADRWFDNIFLTLP